MNTLGQRIRHIIAYSGITMTQFANEINISQSMVSKICADKAAPSDRTIADICRQYNVNKDWLINNNGAMINEGTLSEELMQIFPENPLNKRLISALLRIPPCAWPGLVDYLEEITAQTINNSSLTEREAYDHGFKEGLRFAQKINEELHNGND